MVVRDGYGGSLMTMMTCFSNESTTNLLIVRFWFGSGTREAEVLFVVRGAMVDGG